jgi:hypothetical protein
LKEAPGLAAVVCFRVEDHTPTTLRLPFRAVKRCSVEGLLCEQRTAFCVGRYRLLVSLVDQGHRGNAPFPSLGQPRRKGQLKTVSKSIY